MMEEAVKEVLRDICERKDIEISCNSCIYNGGDMDEADCYQAAADTILEELGAHGLMIVKVPEEILAAKLPWEEDWEVVRIEEIPEGYKLESKSETIGSFAEKLAKAGLGLRRMDKKDE